MKLHIEMETLDQSILRNDSTNKATNYQIQRQQITNYKELVRARRGPLAPRSHQIYWLARLARFALRARDPRVPGSQNESLSLARRPSEACFSEREARHFPARQTQPRPGFSELPLKG